MKFEPLMALGLITVVLGLVLVFAWPRLAWRAFAAGLVAIVIGAGVILWRALVVFGVVTFVAIGTAFAADDTIVQVGAVLTDLRPTIEVGLMALGGVIVTWVALLLRRTLNLTIDEKLRDLLQLGIANGVHLALDRLQARADGKTVDVRSQALADVIAYVRTFNGQAVKHFDLSDTRLAARIAPQLDPHLPVDASPAGAVS